MRIRPTVAGRNATNALSSTAMSQKCGAKLCEGEVDVAEEEPHEVDEMAALVDELAAAGYGLLSPPFLLVARSAAMTIAASEVQQASVVSAAHEVQCAKHCGVKAVIEAHPYVYSGCSRLLVNFEKRR